MSLWLLGDQSIRNCAVTWTRDLLEPAAIHQRNAAAAVRDESLRLQLARNGGHCLATGAEHVRQKLLCHGERGPIHAIVNHQHPSRASLRRGVGKIAGGTERDLLE